VSDPIKIVAVLTALPGKEAALRSLLVSMIAPSRTEPGNLRYDLWRDREEAGRFILDELYTDLAAVDTHRATPHFQVYRSSIEQLAHRSAFVLDPLDAT